MGRVLIGILSASAILATYVLGILIASFIVKEADKNWDTKPAVQPAIDAKRTDVKLIEELTFCVDHDAIIVDDDRLVNDFLPRLDLGRKDRVMYGVFGSNASGRWFSITVKKASLSGRTTGYFDVTFYTEYWQVPTKKGEWQNSLYKIVFKAHHGSSYTRYDSADLNKINLVDIYDQCLQEYVIGDSGQARPGSYVANTIGNGISDLLGSGMTVGRILEKYLTYLEESGQGGQEYTDEAEKDHLEKTESLKGTKQLMVFFETPSS